MIHAEALVGLRSLADRSVNVCVTSPPYFGLRDYGVKGQIGLERTPDEYVARLVEVFREVRRVLRDDGTVWLNLGDSYASGGMSNPSNKSTLLGGKDLGASAYSISRAIPSGLKRKDLIGIPWRVAFALQADGWYLRSDIIWAKPNPMPESVTDRPTKAHEYVFLLSKNARYAYDADAVSEAASSVGDTRHLRLDRASNFARHDNGSRSRTGNPQARTRNRRTVWTVTPKPYAGAHFAVMPEALVQPCVLAGSPVGGLVLDPFAGSGTVGVVALKNGRSFVGIELNSAYIKLARARLAAAVPKASAAAA